jgi:1-acyl-sn-glycerol-3-phosphate acyltransferase
LKFKNLLYYPVKLYVKIGLFFYYKSIKVSGKKNVPKGVPVLFLANHQNAMLDPLVIATNTHRKMYFLARASAFKTKIGATLLNAIRAIAIYRVRDGADSKTRNEAVFKHCNDLLLDNKSFLIFPEGSHNINRNIRSLRNGFIRISIDFLSAAPEKELYIIPVGLNYTNTKKYASSLHIIYGNAIKASDYIDVKTNTKNRSDLINKVSSELQKLTVHIENDDNYQSIIDRLDENEYLHPKTTNEKIKTLDINSPKKSNSKKRNVFYYIMLLNSIFPFLAWSWLIPKVKQKEFISTAKFSLGLTAFPIFYTLQTLLICHYFSGFIAILYILFCFLTVLLSTKTR